MSSRVTDEDKGYSDVLKTLKDLGSPSLTVGIHDKDNKPYQRGSGSSATTAQIGTFHEFGTLDRYEDKSKAGGGSGKRGVPQRSFLRSTVDENEKKYIGIASKGLDKVVMGKMTIDRLFGLLGAKIVGDVQKKISSGIEPALTEARKAQKAVAGKGGNTPLVHFGQLRQSINYEIKK